MKLIIIVLIIVVLITGYFVYRSLDTAEILSYEIHEYIDKTRDAFAYHNILQSHLAINGSLQRVFPDNYAGVFLEGEILVIQLTDVSQESIELYENWLGLVSSSPVRFKKVQFSYNELWSFGKIFLEALRGQGADLTSFVASTRYNIFMISLYENDETSVEIVKKFENLNAILNLPMHMYLGGHFIEHLDYDY